MELGHWVTGSVGHLGHLSNDPQLSWAPGHLPAKSGPAYFNRHGAMALK